MFDHFFKSKRIEKPPSVEDLDVEIEMEDITALRIPKLQPDPSNGQIETIPTQSNRPVIPPEDARDTAINTSVMRHRGKIFAQVKAQVMEYLDHDCNADSKIANRSNIMFLVNHDQREILLRGISLGKLCLNSANKEYLRQLIRPTNYRLRIE